MEYLDYRATLKRLMNDVEFVGELYTTFLDTYDSRINHILELMDSGSYDALWKEAHGLKGASGTINAARLQACALELEEAARAQDAEALRLLRPRFAEVCHETAAHIRQWLVTYGDANAQGNAG